MAKHDDSPAGLAALLKGGEADATPVSTPGDEPPEGMEDAASDLITAVHGHDVKGTAHALHNAHSLSAAHAALKKG
jgi:hypothetical protein